MNHLKFLSLPLLVLTLILPILAFGQTDTATAAATVLVEQQDWWQNLLVHVIQAALAIFVPVLSLLLIRLAKKWGVNLEQQTVDNILSKAAGFAEQKANGLLKEGAPKTGSAEKLGWALEMAELLVSQAGLEKKASGELKKLIEAKLGETAIKNGSTK